MWIAYIALFAALLAVFASVLCYLELQKRPQRSDIRDLLSTASEDLLKASKSSVKMIEAEWDDMYSKFSKLAGRIDRQRQLQGAGNGAAPQAEAAPASRSDLLRRRTRQ